MEGFVAHRLAEFEQGKISRRKLIETLTLAITTAYATESAGAAEQPGLKIALINHISYTCPNFRQAADWYSKIFNLDQIGARDRDVALPSARKASSPTTSPPRTCRSRISSSGPVISIRRPARRHGQRCKRSSTTSPTRLRISIARRRRRN